MTDDEFTPSPAQVSGTLQTLLKLMSKDNMVELWAQQLHEDAAPAAYHYVDNADHAKRTEHGDVLVRTFRWLVEHSNGPTLWQVSVELPAQFD